MAFGLNSAQLIGRLGRDVEISTLQSGKRVANLNVATDESFIDKSDGSRVDRVEWHRVVTFQDGVIDMLEKNGRKGRLVYIEGKLQTRKWRKDGEDTDRLFTEIMLVPGSRVQFLTKADAAAMTNGQASQEAAGQAPSDPATSDEPPF